MMFAVLRFLKNLYMVVPVYQYINANQLHHLKLNCILNIFTSSVTFSYAPNCSTHKGSIQMEHPFLYCPKDFAIDLHHLPYTVQLNGVQQWGKYFRWHVVR